MSLPRTATSLMEQSDVVAASPEQFTRVQNDLTPTVEHTSPYQHTAAVGMAAAEHDASYSGAGASDLSTGGVYRLHDFLWRVVQRSADDAASASAAYHRAQAAQAAACRVLALLDGEMPDGACREHAVLVVEDDGVMTEQVTQVLRSAGFIVRIAPRL